MKKQLRDQVAKNIFHLARKSVEPWNKFPWHPDANKCLTWRPNSSQALAIDIFGTLKMAKEAVRDELFDFLCLMIGLPAGGPWHVWLEWQDADNILNETRSKTQVDVFAEGRHSLILVEVKFSELGGCCSQTAPLKKGRFKGMIQCNGNYQV